MIAMRRIAAHVMFRVASLLTGLSAWSRSAAFALVRRAIRLRCAARRAERNGGTPRTVAIIQRYAKERNDELRQ